MNRIAIGLLVAAGVAGLWAAQRATAMRRAPAVALVDRQSRQAGAAKTPNATAKPAPSGQDSIDPKMAIAPKADIDPKMAIAPKADIDPKMVVNPPPRRSPADKTNPKPRSEQ